MPVDNKTVGSPDEESAEQQNSSPIGDKYPAETRSRMMSAVRSRGNKSTERRLRAYLVRYGLRGWRVQPKDIAGKPDFVFDANKVVVFVDGCFWHKCPICCRMPHTRQDYWEPKIEGNRQRDIRITQTLTQAGWTVLRFWEHEIRDNPREVVGRIKGKLAISTEKG